VIVYTFAREHACSLIVKVLSCILITVHPERRPSNVVRSWQRFSYTYTCRQKHLCEFLCFNYRRSTRRLFYIAIHQVSLLSHAACASMSTTTSTTTTTTRDRGDRYGPMEWAQLGNGALHTSPLTPLKRRTRLVLAPAVV